MKHSIHYQMTLSAPQLEYLAGSKYHKNRMAFFLNLVKSAVLKPSKSLVPGCDRIIAIGQVEKSEVQLAKDWDCDRKTVSKVIAKMNELGIITTEKSNRTSVHTIHPVAAWIVDNMRIRNPYFRTGYDYRQIHEGAFESIPTASDFIKENMPDNATDNPDKLSAGDKDFPKGKTSNRNMVRLLPTIRNFEKYEQRETDTSTSLCSLDGSNDCSSDKERPTAQSSLPSFRYSHSNEREMPVPIPSNTNEVQSKAKEEVAVGLENDVEDNTSRTPSTSETPQLPFEEDKAD